MDTSSEIGVKAPGSAERPKTMHAGMVLLLLVAATLLVGFSSGRWSGLAPLAAWLGPALFIRFYREQRLGTGYLPLALASLAGATISWWQVFPLPMMAFYYALYGLMGTVPYLADRLLAPRIGGFLATLVFPLAASTWEFANLLLNPLGSWGATAYSQYGDLPLLQLASLTGMTGITFLMGWFASVVNWAWENRPPGREIGSGLALYGVVLAAVLIFGILRLALASLPSETVRVTGITAQSVRKANISWNGDMPDAVTARAQVADIRNAYFDATVREARSGAKVVVWPEASGFGAAADDAELVAQARAVARQEKIYLAVPLLPFDPALQRPIANKLLVVDPAGELVLEHLKYGGSFMEGIQPGDRRLRSVATSFGVLSGVICWDLDFPEVIRQAGESGVSLLLVPSSDWAEITPVHGQMAVFRAVENGVSLVRQTDEGLSIAVDPYGRVLAQMDHFATTDRTMVAQLPIRPVPTVYSARGYLFGWLAVAGFGLLLLGGTVMKTWLAARGRARPGTVHQPV